MWTIKCVVGQYCVAMGAAQMLSLVAVKKRFIGHPLTANGTTVCSRPHHLPATGTHSELFHYVWPKAEPFQILKANLLCHYAHTPS